MEVHVLQSVEDGDSLALDHLGQIWDDVRLLFGSTIGNVFCLFSHNHEQTAVSLSVFD